ncbi:MAG: hypothetical protein F6K00_20665 [Leptolyngbya sp. SIOISBB]|nr:hypothetical protein [Leptolyngbya sp. SIOISBB]
MDTVIGQPLPQVVLMGSVMFERDVTLLIPRTMLSLGLLLPNLAVWAGDAHSSEFHFSADEKVILDADFEHQGDWQLSAGLQVESGWLSYAPDARNTFAIASFVLDRSLSPAGGAINLYWRASFPEHTKTESNAYIPALQYAENPIVCWQTADNSVSLLPGQTCRMDTTAIREDAELRAWLRSQKLDEHPQTRLYVDPDFTPGVEPENRDTAKFPYVGLPHQGNQQRIYRLRIEQLQNQYQASLAMLQEGNWQRIGSPLAIAPEQWRFVVGQTAEGYRYAAETAFTFEQINVLMRHDPARAEFTRIDAIALTQERSRTVSAAVLLFGCFCLIALLVIIQRVLAQLQSD